MIEKLIVLFAVLFSYSSAQILNAGTCTDKCPADQTKDCAGVFCTLNNEQTCVWQCPIVLNCDTGCTGLSKPCAASVCKVGTNGCFWTIENCPAIKDCTDFCLGATCPTNTAGLTRTYCGPNADNTECIVKCASGDCNTACQNSACPKLGVCAKFGTSTVCESKCFEPTVKPCFDAIGNNLCSGDPRCLGSVCTPTLNSYGAPECRWTTPTDSCPVAPPPECTAVDCTKNSGDPLCSNAKCGKDNSGTCVWDKSGCGDCSLLYPETTKCPRYQSCPREGTGRCVQSSSGCTWTCPADICANACPTTNETLSIPRCLEAIRVCLPTIGSTITTPECRLSPKCLKWDETPIDCEGKCLGNIPTAGDCKSFHYKCGQVSGVGTCTWLTFCDDVSPVKDCLETDCNEEEANTDSTDICLTETSVTGCRKDASGRCSKQKICPNIVPVVKCTTDKCRSTCFNAELLTSTNIVNNAVGDISRLTESCNLTSCKRCELLKTCGASLTGLTCEFHSGDEYNDCLKKCDPTADVPPINCKGSDPCSCNYDLCLFVNHKDGKGGACKTKEFASVSVRLGAPYIDSRPTYCSFNIKRDEVQTLIDRVAADVSGDLSIEFLKRVDDLKSIPGNEILTKFIAIINQVQTGQLSTDNIIDWTIGFTIDGDTTPTQEVVDKYCAIVKESFSAKSNIDFHSFTCTPSAKKRSLLQAGGTSYDANGQYNASVIDNNSTAPTTGVTSGTQTTTGSTQTTTGSTQTTATQTTATQTTATQTTATQTTATQTTSTQTTSTQTTSAQTTSAQTTSTQTASATTSSAASLGMFGLVSLLVFLM